MDVTFNAHGAYEALQNLSQETTNGLSLSDLMQTTGWSNGVRVDRVEHPTTWRLLRGNNGAEEELVFTLRGVILLKDLPPMLERPRLSAGRYKYLRQAITISGLGTPSFDRAMAAASEIFGAFDRSFPDGQMESWTSSGTRGPGDCAALDASNRYMVPRREAPNSQHQPFTSSVDPKGILERMATESEHIHTEENEVVYFTSQSIKPGERTFHNAQPQIFRVGDIVEIQLSFVVVPLKGEQHKMVTVLHSIALLDGTFGQSLSMCKKIPRHAHVAPKVLSVKRRIGYESTQVAGEGKRGRMEPNEETGLANVFSTQL